MSTTPERTEPVVYPWATTLRALAVAAVALLIAAVPPHIWLDAVLRVLAFILIGLAALHALLWLAVANRRFRGVHR